MRLGRSAHGQDAAGITFLQNRVAAVPALFLRDLGPQCRAVSYHGGDTELAVLLGIRHLGMDEKNTAGVNVNGAAYDIVFKLRLADL